MGWDGMGWDGMGWAGMGRVAKISVTGHFFTRRPCGAVVFLIFHVIIGWRL